MQLLISILHIYMEIKSMEDNQKLYPNNKENRLELGNIPLLEIPENQKVTWDRNCILIAIIAFCILYYAKN